MWSPIVDSKSWGTNCIEIFHKDTGGQTGSEILYTGTTKRAFRLMPADSGGALMAMEPHFGLRRRRTGFI